MPREPEERYLEWLTREEEEVGLDKMLRGTTDFASARKLLIEELEIDPTEPRIRGLVEWGTARYEYLPQLGVRHEMVEMWWGSQSTYRDIVTGRYVPAADVMAALRTFY